ncbi:MAG: hypothetical protein ACXWV5_12980, partial [Flavitalea sp.]
MEKIPGPGNYLKITVLLIFSLSLQTLKGQQKQLYDYAVFAGFGKQSIGKQFTLPAEPGYGVFLGTEVNTRGDVGSYSFIQTFTRGTINGNVNSGGKISFASNNSITGNITSENSPLAPGTILLSGLNTTIKGNLDVNGNIKIRSGSVVGNISQPAGSSYIGPAPTLGRNSDLSFPVLPDLPEIIPFEPGSINISDSRTINPGKYGNLALGGGKTIRFSGSGDYYFNSIQNTGSFNNFEFDFSANPRGLIRIFVKGDANLHQMKVNIINGSPSQIYLETHGNGSQNGGFSFILSSGTPDSKISEWNGTVYAPFAAIRVGLGGGKTSIKGALYSGTQAIIYSFSTIEHVALKETSVIFSDYDPESDGKAETIIGSELISLAKNYQPGDSASANVYIINNDSVYIEVITRDGKTATVLQLLQGPDYGLTNIIDDGSSSLIICGKFPIAKLPKLDELPDLIN